MTDRLEDTVDDLMTHRLENTVDGLMTHRLEDTVDGLMIHRLEDTMDNLMTHRLEDTVDGLVTHRLEDTMDNLMTHRLEDTVDGLMIHRLEDTMDNLMTHRLEDDVEDDKDANGGGVYTFPTPSKDCCVRAVLVAVVVSTAIVLVVIVASLRKKDDDMKPTVARTESVYWQQTGPNKRMVFEHQFLLKDPSEQRPMRILAIDEARQMYLIVWHEMNKHYNLYLAVDFEKSTETILVAAKSENRHGTNIEENLVLFCEAKRFDRAFHGSFANVLDILEFQASGTKIKSRDPQLMDEINYVGGPLTVERFISIVVNSSCDDLPRTAVFQWNKPDESLACGERTYSEAELSSCSRDLCQTFPGSPLSRSQVCHNFRSCNYVQKSCDPYYRHNPGKVDAHPYCICRKTATQNTETVTCPRIADDGGECELPRRDLLEAQKNLPCLCLYRFRLVFPHKLRGESSISLNNRAKEDPNVVHWSMKEISVTGPALRFSHCSC